MAKKPVSARTSPPPPKKVDDNKGKRIPGPSTSAVATKGKTAAPTTSPPPKTPRPEYLDTRVRMGPGANTKRTQKLADRISATHAAGGDTSAMQARLVERQGKIVDHRRDARQAARVDKLDDKIAEARRKAGIHRTSPMNSADLNRMGAAPSRASRDAEADLNRLRNKRIQVVRKQNRRDEIREVAGNQINRAMGPVTQRPTTTPPKPPTTTTAPKPPTTTTKPPTTPPKPPTTVATPKPPSQGVSRPVTTVAPKPGSGGGGNRALGGAQGVQRVAENTASGSAGMGQTQRGGSGRLRFY